MPNLNSRTVDAKQFQALIAQGYPAPLCRALAARGMGPVLLPQSTLHNLLPWKQLKGVEEAAFVLSDAIEAEEKIVIVADYDADGATACAVGLLGLRSMGAQVDFVVPNRFTMGYGLSPEVVGLAASKNPGLIVTVDNGIASLEGVEVANALGIPVIVTDHHLPGDIPPQAVAIVNPNQKGCKFPSKNLAGVGVIFYTLMALRAELKSRGHFEGKEEPHLGRYLDLVALGTVADVVALDHNNRLLVREGVKRIVKGQASPGIQALIEVAGKNPATLACSDLGFSLGPRLNAAGRMEDMTHGIACLISPDLESARKHAEALDGFNRDRREVEEQMQQEALAALEGFEAGTARALSVFNQEWHPGVVGILASRLKDRFHRPTMVFAPDAETGFIRGSGRSIAGFHLRDALDQLTRHHPGMITRFGGHAAAAGATLPRERFDEFQAAFDTLAKNMLSDEDLEQQLEYDGEIRGEEITPELALALTELVWGQGYPEPLFGAELKFVEQRLLNERHLKALVEVDGRRFQAIWFNQPELQPDRVFALFRISLNEWNGNRQLQLELRYSRV